MEKFDVFSDPLTPEARYRLLVEAIMGYAIYMLDPTGIVRTWNPGAQRVKGYTSSEIIGQHFSRFYSEEDQKSGLPAKALASALAGSKAKAGASARTARVSGPMS